MKKPAFGVSPITNEIYCGRLNKTGQIFSDKVAVTNDVIKAVMEHLYQKMNFGENGSYSCSHPKDKNKELILTITVADKDVE